MLIDVPANAPSGASCESIVCALEPLVAQSRGRLNGGYFEETAPCGLCFTSAHPPVRRRVSRTRIVRATCIRCAFSRSMAWPWARSGLRSRSGADVPCQRLGSAVRSACRGAKLGSARSSHRWCEPGRAHQRRRRLTVAAGVATVWLELGRPHRGRAGIELPHTRSASSSGVRRCLQALMERVEERLGVVVQTSWGMTELSPSGTVASRDAVSRAAHLSGRPAVEGRLAADRCRRGARCLSSAEGGRAPAGARSVGHRALFQRGAARDRRRGLVSDRRPGPHRRRAET